MYLHKIYGGKINKTKATNHKFGEIIKRNLKAFFVILGTPLRVFKS